MLFFSLLFILSCKQENKSFASANSEVDTAKILVTDNWQEGFGLTHNPEVDSVWGKPVAFYLNQERCDETAMNFYFGKYRPMDEPETARLLELVTTDNDSLRPFYRWILNKTILIQDGALGEYTGVPARGYAEKFPSEFFEYMDYDKSGQKYSDWVNAILYSGFYEKEIDNQENISHNLHKTMLKNCTDCSPELKKRIEKFSTDCFPNN